MQEYNRERIYPMPLNPDYLKIIHWKNGEGQPIDDIKFENSTDFSVQAKCLEIARSYGQHPDPNTDDYKEWIEECKNWTPEQGFGPSIILFLTNPSKDGCVTDMSNEEYIELKYQPSEE